MSDIPVNRRMYISESEVGKFTSRGITVYTGPRGGKYVDINELKEKGLLDGDKFGGSSSTDSKKEILDLILSDSKKRREFLSVVRMTLENINKSISESIRKGAMVNPEVIEKAKEISMANDIIDKLDASNLLSKPIGSIDFSELGVKGGAHSSMMKVFVFKDGSRVFGKGIYGKYGPGYYLLGNIFNSAALKCLDIIVPTGRLIKDEKNVYVGVSEVYGVDINTFGYAGEAIENAIKNGFISVDDRFVRSLVSGLIVGLTDLYVHNFMLDPRSNKIIAYDLDFSLESGSDIGMILADLIEAGYITYSDVGKHFMDLWKSKKDEVKKNIKIARQYIIDFLKTNNVQDKDIFDYVDKLYNDWMKWFDDVEELVSSVGEDPETLGIVLVNGGWRE